MLKTTTSQVFKHSIISLLVSLPMASAIAADSRPERPKGPPPEAMTACESLSKGDACSVSTPHGEMSGHCKAPPSGQEGPLACVPEGGPRGGMSGERPPKEG